MKNERIYPLVGVAKNIKIRRTGNVAQSSLISASDLHFPKCVYDQVFLWFRNSRIPLFEEKNYLNKVPPDLNEEMSRSTER